VPSFAVWWANPGDLALHDGVLLDKSHNGEEDVTVELAYLGWAAVLTLLIRVPWMVNKVTVRGLSKVTGYPADSEPLSPWAHRVWISHEDAVDNLIVFAVLLAVLHLVGESNVWTQTAAMVYFWARLGHFLVYAFGIPRAKTIAFLAGFGAQLVLAWQVLVQTW
jgi:uncharacterized MAPEG superfamily protein